MCWRVSIRITELKQDLILKALIVLAMVGSLLS